MILDYSQFITEEGTKGIVNFVSADRNASVFRHDSICPFCRRKIENVVYQKHKYDTPEWLFGSFEEWEYVIQCESCGWWEYKYSNCSDAIIDGIRASDVKYSSAILKSYDEDSINVLTPSVAFGDSLRLIESKNCCPFSSISKPSRPPSLVCPNFLTVQDGKKSENTDLTKSSILCALIL